MKVSGLRSVLVGLALCVSVVGCSHHLKRGNGVGSENDAVTYGAGDNMGFAGDERDLLAQRKIYFAFDRSDISESDYGVIAAHAAFLKQSPNRHVRVEGHADEQGSREYNIALGERRARAVAQALHAQGVQPSQISTVSYGREKPDVVGHGEEAYRLNRRAVIVYEEI